MDKNQDPGSGINIPDPQHGKRGCLLVFKDRTLLEKESIDLGQLTKFISWILSWPCWNAYFHLLPTFRGEVEAPEVLVVVKLCLCRTGKFATEDPELAAALGHQHRLPYNQDKIGVSYEQKQLPRNRIGTYFPGSEILLL